MIDERKDEANKLEQDVELLKRRINRLKLKQELEERSAKNMVTRLKKPKELTTCESGAKKTKDCNESSVRRVLSSNTSKTWKWP